MALHHSVRHRSHEFRSLKSMHRVATMAGVVLLFASICSAQARLRITVNGPRILDSGPIAGATVSVVLESDGSVVAQGMTDFAGTVTLNVRPERVYTVTATAPGFEPDMDADTKPPAGDIPVELLIAPEGAAAGLVSLAPPGAEMPPASAMIRNGLILGQVVDENGKPMPFLSVRTTVNGEPVPYGGITNELGVFRLSVPPGTYGIYTPTQPTTSNADPGPPVIAGRQATMPVLAQVASGRVTAGLLFAALPVFGVNALIRVVDDLGRPVQNARVQGYSTRNEPWSSGGFNYWTDEVGEVSVSRMLPGQLTVVARIGTAGTTRAAQESFTLAGTGDTFTLQLHKGGVATGVVRFVGTPPLLASPFELTVMAAMPGASTPSSKFSSDDNGVVARDGRFRVWGLAGPQCLQLWGVPTGWRVARVSVGGIDLTDRAVDFEPGSRLQDLVVLLERGELPPWSKCRQ